MEKIVLFFPTERLEQAALEYRDEHFRAGETVINGSALFDLADSYAEWLKMVRANADIRTVNPSRVESETFFAVRESDNRIVGVINFRHTLNDFLRDYGHIGYSIRPSERRKGYAAEMLRLVLELARSRGLTEVFLSCGVTNTGSMKTIQHNGGIRVRTFTHDDGKEEAIVFKIEL